MVNLVRKVWNKDQTTSWLWCLTILYIRSTGKKMNLEPFNKNLLIVYTFGTTKSKNIESPVVELGILVKQWFYYQHQSKCCA